MIAQMVISTTVLCRLTVLLGNTRLTGGGRKGLELSNRLDQVLIDCDEIRPIFVVNENVGQADEEACFFVDRVGDTISHRRDQEVSDIGAIDRPYTNADFLALGHDVLLPPRRLSLAFSAKKLLSLTQLLVFVLAHFLSALL
jgi:hypothetical protein